MAALRDAFAKYGPIFKKTVMGRTIVFFGNPSDVEAVFKGDGRFPVRSDDLFKPQREYMNSRKLPEGLASLTDGEKWSRLRKALASKMLRPKDIRENLDNFNSVARDAIERMVAIRGEDDVIPNLEGELAKYATESVGTMAFDLRVGLYEDPPNQDIIKVIQATFDGFKYLGYLNRGWESQLYRFVTTPSYRKFCKTQDTLFSIGQKIVDKKVADLKKFTEEGDEFVENQAVPLLTYLILKGELTPQEINVNSIFMFRAGVETTSTSLLFLLYDLARYPAVQEKVYEEVTSLIGPHGDFTPDTFAKLDYLKACVKESMRLHPAIRWERRLTQDVVLSGYKVPSGVSAPADGLLNWA
ncbi:cytochrome P450 27C1-like [Orbicella faveolata]|uniref:cytochrome P450 27C1-like n=1 Tax=Orbicella faveolata TaxID=48498 RepID=UPI0009E47FDF|nr:cytochrome P450 27C1-like [Orbicella faveolata]